MKKAGHSFPMLSEALMEKGHKVSMLIVETKSPESNSTMTTLRALIVLGEKNPLNL